MPLPDCVRVLVYPAISSEIKRAPMALPDRLTASMHAVSFLNERRGRPNAPARGPWEAASINKRGLVLELVDTKEDVEEHLERESAKLNNVFGMSGLNSDFAEN